MCDDNWNGSGPTRASTATVTRTNRCRVMDASVSLFGSGSRVGKQLVVFRGLRRYALLLGDLEARRLQAVGQLVERDPRAGVVLRVVYRDRLLEVIRVDAVIRLDHVQRVAVRTPGVVEPRAIVESIRVGDERVVIHPSADRVAPETGFRWRRTFDVPPGYLGIGRELSPIGPDDAPFLVDLIEDH